MTTQTKVLIAALGLTVIIGGGVAIVAYNDEKRRKELRLNQPKILDRFNDNPEKPLILIVNESKQTSNKNDDATISKEKQDNNQSDKTASQTDIENVVVSNLPPLRWTQSKIVLEFMEDPNNPGLDEYNRRRRQQEKINSPVGQIYQGIRTALGLVPYIGPVITVLANLFDLLGENVVGGWTSGGFGNLQKSARQRIVLYKLITNVLRNSPFSSQRYDEVQKPTKPRKDGLSEQQYSQAISVYDEEYAKWVRYWLISTAIKAEQYRCTVTSDEAMLPAAVIDLLVESEQWPPPIEPMPLTKEQWLARRTDPASKFYIDWTQIDPSDPIVKRTYEIVRSEYESDARKFANAISNVTQPPEIVALARKNGSIPQIGSPAAPLKSKFEL